MTTAARPPAFGSDRGTTFRHGPETPPADPGGRGDRASQPRRAPRAALAQLDRTRKRLEIEQTERELRELDRLTGRLPAPEPAPAPDLWKTHRVDGEERPNRWDPGRIKHRRRQQARLADGYRRAGLVDLADEVERCGTAKAVALVDVRRLRGGEERPLGELLAMLDAAAAEARARIERDLDAAGVTDPDERERVRAARAWEVDQKPLGPREVPVWPDELGDPDEELLGDLEARGLGLVLSRPAGQGGAPRALVHTCGQRHCVEGCGAQHAAHARSRVLDRVAALRPLTDDDGNELVELGDLLGALVVPRPGYEADQPPMTEARRARIDALAARSLEVDDDEEAEALLEQARRLEHPQTLREAELLVVERTGLKPRQRKPTYLLETARLEARIEREWHDEMRRKYGKASRADDDDKDDLDLRLRFARAARGKAYGGKLRLTQHTPARWEWTRLHLHDDEAQLWTFTRPQTDGEPCALSLWHEQRALSLFWAHEEVARRTYAHVQAVEPEWSSPATRQRVVTQLHEEANALDDRAREMLDTWDHEAADRLEARARAVREQAAGLSARGRDDWGSRWHTHAHVVAWVHGGFWAHHRALPIWRDCIRQAYLDGVDMLREQAAWLLGVGLAADNRAAVDDAATVEELAARRAERLRSQAKLATTGARGALPRARSFAKALRYMAHELEALAFEQSAELRERIESTTTKAQRKEVARGFIAIAEAWAREATLEGRGGLNFRPRRRGEKVEARIAEAVKYATKTMGSKHTEMPLDALADLVAATRGRRLLKCGGLLYGVTLDEEHEPTVNLEGGPIEVDTTLPGERIEVWGYAPDGSKVFEDEVVWLDGSDPLASWVRTEALRLGWEAEAQRRREERKHRQPQGPPRRRRR